jgi:hypothetical protein
VQKASDLRSNCSRIADHRGPSAASRCCSRSGCGIDAGGGSDLYYTHGGRGSGLRGGSGEGLQQVAAFEGCDELQQF